MTPEEKSLLERTYKMAEENNEILKSIRRSNRMATLMRVGYWVVIILLSFGAFYFIQPYFSLLSSTYGGGIPSLQQTQDSANQLKDLLK